MVATACTSNPFLRPGPSLADVAARDGQAYSLARRLAGKGYDARSIAQRSGLAPERIERLLGDAAPDPRVKRLRQLPAMMVWAIAQLLDADRRVWVGPRGTVLVDGRRLDPDAVLAHGLAAFEAGRRRRTMAGGDHA